MSSRVPIEFADIEFALETVGVAEEMSAPAWR